MSIRAGRRSVEDHTQPVAAADPNSAADPTPGADPNSAADPTPAADPNLAAPTSPRLGATVEGDDEHTLHSGTGRRLAFVGMLVIFLATPLANAVHRHMAAPRFGLLVAVLVSFFALFGGMVLTRDADLVGRPTPWFRLIAITVFGLLLPVLAGPTWLTATGIVGACYAAYLPARMAASGVVVTGLYCGIYALAAGLDQGTAIVYGFEPLVIGGFAYASGRRVELIRQLRATRRELARTAVAEERLRISRDLHDLLGHSLSVIAVKAELARRMMPADPERAQREIGEVEAAARRALVEVRDAVSGYRTPSLAVELVSARRAVTSAGVRCLVDAPEEWSLPPEVDALLAWAVREGATNVVRHGAATRCDIRLTVAGAEAALELTNDGAVLDRIPAGAGNGLAGLAERAGLLGGVLTAGRREAGGYRLRVSVPV